MDKLKSLKLWWFFFLYTFCVSAFLQFILLPYVFSSLYAGNGLLRSSYDSIFFHKLAVDLANRMHVQGWSVWQLKPQGQGPIGIASMLYFLILPDPRIFIPINAALHATAALLLVKLLNIFLKDQTKAVICSLPFLVFPSNLQWTAQLHKDNYSTLGVFLILYCMVSLVRLENWRDNKRYLVIFRSIIFYVVGVFLIWFVRPYMLSMIKFILVFFSPLVLIVYLTRKFKNRWSWRKTLYASLLLPLTLIVLLRMPTKSYEVQEAKRAEAVYINEPALVTKTEPDQIELIQNSNIEDHWIRLSWLPPSIEKTCQALAQLRKGMRLTDLKAKSNIDLDVGFNSVKSTLCYLPRAAQIVFLAPFPTEWFKPGRDIAGSLMRREAIFEMVIIYFALIFLPYAIWYWRKRIEIWIISIFCIFMMLVYGLVFCNIGTLYRMRYAYMTTLVALGIAGFITLLKQITGVKRNE